MTKTTLGRLQESNCVCVTLLKSGVVVQLPKNIMLNTEPKRAVTIPDLYFSLSVEGGLC